MIALSRHGCTHARTGRRLARIERGTADRHLLQVRALLRGEAVELDGGMAQLLASPGLLPDRPIKTPLLLAAQGPKGRAVAKEIADGLVALVNPGKGFNPCIVSRH